MIENIYKSIINMRRSIKNYIPERVLNLLSSMLHLWRENKNKKRNVHTVFDEIYKHSLWGGKDGTLCSGHGSIESLFKPYCKVVVKAIESESEGNINLTIVDIGCGDFNVGRYLLNSLHIPVHYIGIDAAPSVIKHHNDNKDNFKFDMQHIVEFRCLDAVTDQLPGGDVCLIRQVLQHLSNQQILSILNKMDNYPMIFITEEDYFDNQHVQPNLDLIHGSRTRVSINSALYLDQPPFSLTGIQELLSLRSTETTLLKTYLISKEVAE